MVEVEGLFMDDDQGVFVGSREEGSGWERWREFVESLVSCCIYMLLH